MENTMSKNVNYTTELEQLVVDTLLPAYEDYCRRFPFSPLAKQNIDYSFIEPVRNKRDPGALLKPRKNLS
jgi:hypothetical protein